MGDAAPPLAIFDLDNTLLAGDSDHAWGEFLCANGVVDAATHRRANAAFYAQYRAGTLDIQAFLAFALEVLARLPMGELSALRERFMRECVEPMVLPAAEALLDAHRRAGHRLMIITATNRFVTEPIARRFGVGELLATEPEVRAGRYTGRAAGTPCFREGKVERLREWLAARGETWPEAWFYSDSHNDLPLLERVAHPVAVDPDPQLAAAAAARGWPQISLRRDDFDPSVTIGGGSRP